jgi:recombination protein RecR
MAEYPNSFQKLLDSFRRLPQVGNKAAIRFVYAVLSMSDEEVRVFAENLVKIKQSLRKCKQCNNLCEEELCNICKNPARDYGTICVVTSSKDVVAMENVGQYQGVYHVLDGEISPSKGVLPDDLHIANLLLKIDDRVKEVIIATNSTVDGEITAMYISKLLNGKPIIVSRLAHGIPIGGQLDYADERTLIKALEGRTRY